MLATLASTTSANRLRRRLSELGIYSTVLQTPHTLTKEGCGYSLRFDESTREIVEKVAYELKIKIRMFYSETYNDGKIVYTAL